MHSKQGLATFLLAHDALSSLAYPMITHTPPVASYKNFGCKACAINGHGQQLLTYTVHAHIPVADAESKLGRCLEVACDDLYLEMTIFT